MRAARPTVPTILAPRKNHSQGRSRGSRLRLAHKPRPPLTLPIGTNHPRRRPGAYRKDGPEWRWPCPWKTMQAAGGPVKKRSRGADLVVVEGVGATVQATWDAHRRLGPHISNERGRTFQYTRLPPPFGLSMFLQCLGSSARRASGPWSLARHNPYRSSCTVQRDIRWAAGGAPPGVITHKGSEGAEVVWS